MALVGAPSRFSVLKTDVADPSERKRAPVKNQPAAPVKKQQPNKKNAKNNNTNNKKKKAQSAAQPQTTGDSSKFDEWKKKDEELVDSTYERDLQEAVLMSRLEQENKIEERQRAEDPNLDSAELKKKGKVTLSLREFHEKFSDERPPPPPTTGEPLAKVLALQRDREEVEHRLRLNSEREASAIVAREKIQQDFKEKASDPKTVTQEKYDEMFEMKRKQIEHMAKVLNTTNKELAILQEQNADLEKLLARGELKRKVDLIKEVEELRLVKDELTEQIQTLYAALEQEKSKTSQLTQELQRRR